MKGEAVVKNAEEQAAGAVIARIVETRLEDLRLALESQDLNLERALEYIEECRRGIYEEVIERGLGRGGPYGAPGFIAEWLEVNVGNAKEVVRGAAAKFSLDNNNGAADYHVGDVAYQSKFVLKYLGLDAVLEHSEKYPDFVKEGGRYSVPADLYAKIKQLAGVPESAVADLPKTEQNLWHKIQHLKSEGIEPENNLGPSAFKYRDARRENIDATIDREKSDVQAKDSEIREGIKAEHRPSAAEAAQAVAVGAALEASMGFALAAYGKIKEGKRVRDFTADDWKDLGLGTIAGAAKGGTRGSAVYVLTNFTKFPSAAATAMVTATFGIIGQSKRLAKGEISNMEFAEACEILCLDSAVSALSSVIGQVAIPVPVLGALVGNMAGTLAYEICKGNLSSRERLIVARHANEAASQISKYDENIREMIVRYEKELQDSLALIDLSFGNATDEALSVAIERAEHAGVVEQMIPKTREDMGRLME